MRAFALSARRVAVTLALGALSVAAGAVLFIAAGVYDVSSTSGHTQPVHTLMEVAMRRSVQVRASGITTPPLDLPALQAQGAACFRDHCVQCHGGPGLAPGPLGLSLQPLPGPLVDAARRWRPAELYWITRHGIKMSGMPAWGLRLHEQDLWALVAFLQQLPSLSPAGFRQGMAAVAERACPVRSPQPSLPRLAGGGAALSGPPSSASASASASASGAAVTESARAPSVPSSPSAAPQRPVAVLFRQYACTACHVVPGVEGSDPQVGPPLHGLARRSLLAGRLAADEDGLVRWIRFPQQVDPDTAMPTVGVPEEDARAMAAHLLRARQGF